MSDHDTPHRTPHDPEEIRRYLLGRLSHEESDALEAHLLHDGRLFELAEATEDDLIDRYVRGELPSDDAKRFERHLLPSRRIGERVEVARALAAWVDRERGGRPDLADRPETGGVVVPMVRRFRRTARLAWAAALVAAIAAGALAFEVARLHERLDDAGTPAAVEQARAVEEAPVPVEEAPVPVVTEPAPADELEIPVEATETVPAERVEDLERELVAARDRIAALESAAADRPATASTTEEIRTATIFLALATRGVDSEEPLSLDDAERAELFLELGRRRPSGKVRAQVNRGDAVIWDDPDVEVVTETGEWMARLVLPRESLAEGRYQVRLTEVGREEEARSYPFSVER